MNPPPRRRPAREWLARIALCLVALVAQAGCQAPPTAPATNEALPLDQAVSRSVDRLAAQLQKLPTLLARIESASRRPVLADPSLDAGTGQQTSLTRLLDERIGERLRAQHPQYELLPFAQASLARAQLLLVATIEREQVGRGGWRIHMALVDLKAGQVVAQASALALDERFDITPTPYYRDTPVILLRDPAVDGYVRTARTAAGGRADAGYLERVAAATMINEATALYDAERYREALGLYRSALAAPTGEQMRAVNGVYLTQWKIGNLAEAEQTFGRLVSMGLAARSLGVKFLFNPGTTDFVSDTRISGPYALWLRQIARQVAGSRVCLEVIGHTSRTGSEAFNDRLSGQRAVAVQRRLEAESPALAGRTKASGVGWRENLVGTGTDDASDSLDRRVEFKVNPC